MRGLILLVAAAVVVGTCAASASAGRPSRDPAPLPSQFTVAGVCAFDVDFTITAQNEYSLTFGNGSQIITGKLFATLTNVDTGKSLDLNVSGPTFTTAGSNQIVLTGRSINFFGPGDLGAGSPGLMVLTNGPAVITFGENNVTFDVRSASVTDLCLALAG